MATLLYRLGRFSYTRPWRVIAAWLLLMAGILGGGFALGGQTQESFAIPGTESQQAIDRLGAVFPSAAGANAQIVVQAPAGESIDADANVDAIEGIVDELEFVDGVEQGVSPFSEYASDAISDDRSTAIISVQFTEQSSSVTDETLEAVKDLAPIATDEGLRVGFGGQVYQDIEYGITPTEIVGVLFAAVVLLVTFGSFLAAGLPLLTAITGIGVSLGGVIAVSAFTTISSATPLLALMIGLAVGIDYALFILSRHRNQLANGMDPEESAATSVATAGSSVVFAGVTVIIALLGLLVVNIPFLNAMGLSAAAGVLVAILVSVSMLPAFMGLARGRLAAKGKSRAHQRAVATVGSGRRSFGERWVTLVLKAPIIAVLAVVGILGTLAIPAFSLTLALPDGGSEPEGSTARDSYDLISDGFGPGHNGPLVVLVDITQTTDILEDLEDIGDELRVLDDVAFVSQGVPNPDLDTGIIQVIPESGPDSPATTALVGAIRDLAPEIENRYDTAISVTGTTAVQIDISTRLNNALVPFGIIVVGLSILLLMMVFRSVFVPVTAAVGFLLSVFASFGVVVAIFQWGWFADVLGVVPGPILSFMPVLLMAVLFGLAMDYQVFLVSGMRETWVHTGDARAAIVRGFTGAARVVTAAALIMFFVFAAFVPEGAGVIKVIALGLAVGILADAFLVRMTLVPAAMALVGKAAWWMPRWLGRILPNVDIEGENLREHRTAVQWAAAQPDDAITAEHLVVGSRDASFGPLRLRVTRGSLALVSGEPAQRRLLALTLAGRLDPIAGSAQVLGHPLPSEAAWVARVVALADVGESEPGEARTTVGELLTERIRLTQPLSQALATRRNARSWVEYINSALQGKAAVTQTTAVASLSPIELAVVLAAAAFAERTPIVVLDHAGGFTNSADEGAFLMAIDRLAPAETTVLLGTPASRRKFPTISRPIHGFDLDSLDRESALR